MKLPPEWPEDDENADDDSMCRLVGSIIIAGGFFLAIAVLILALTSCTSRFYYPNGHLKASIQGDLTYQKTTDGHESVTLKHSPVIRAGGIATSQGIAAAGTAASAVILSRP